MDFLPDVIQIGGYPLSIMVLTGVSGVVLAYLLVALKASRHGGERDRAQELLLDLIVSTILGAKLFYVVMDPVGHLRNPMVLFTFPYGPWALPVGLAIGVLYTAWRMRHVPDRLRVLDLAIGPLVLGLAVGLLGWKTPGAWAFPLLVGCAGLTGLLRKPGAIPGALFTETLVVICAALVLADLPRPVVGWAGVTFLQGLAALAGTAAWLWHTRLDSKERTTLPSDSK